MIEIIIVFKDGEVIRFTRNTNALLDEFADICKQYNSYEVDRVTAKRIYSKSLRQGKVK